MTRTTQQAQARFFKDTEHHELQILRDDGVYRHIRLKVPGTTCMHFDLITWPGYLCYTGDMGTYVLTRLSDMFEFFRKKRRADGTFSIDFRYWAEKCESEGARGDGVSEFDPDAFKREITRQRRRLFVGHGEHMDADERREFWDSLEEVKNSADEGEHRTFSSVMDWSFLIKKRDRWGHDPKWIFLCTEDFPDCKAYTHRFLWCCHAMAWGIEQYDLSKATVAA